MPRKSVSKRSPGNLLEKADADVELIRVRGARTHNLKNVDIDIPRGKVTVITGVSGSGKSSLALDTIFSEGQRQYIESLSAYARQFIDQLQRPDIDSIDGLQPTLCIDQASPTPNARSTVGTVTEIHDYLRLLMARAGTTYCYQCGNPILQQSPDQIQETLLSLPESTKLIILAPMVRGRRGAHQEVFALIRKQGLTRVRVDGVSYELDLVPELELRKNHTIEAVVDRIINRSGVQNRLIESLQLALKLAEGLVSVSYQLPDNGTEWTDRLFSTHYACAACGISYEEVEPRTFSFNSPYGACPDCDGLGKQTRFDPEAILPNPSEPVEKQISSWIDDLPIAFKKKIKSELKAAATDAQGELGEPFDKWRSSNQKRFLHGDGKTQKGILARLESIYQTSDQEDLRVWESLRSDFECTSCRGSRLRKEALSVRIDGKTIHELVTMPISDAAHFFSGLSLANQSAIVAKPILGEMNHRLKFLNQVGVGYLTLDRSSDSLSGGEMQRVRLATSIGSGLVGVCYILDEPSIGLHQRDNDRLIDAIRNLQKLGNSLIVVEHDEAMMRSADVLIDIGPGAGQHGGQIVAMGTPQDVAACDESLTGQYLTGKRVIAVPPRRTTETCPWLEIFGAEHHNLQKVNARIPLGTLVGITGVSGSGKSSLINDTLAPALLRMLGRVAPRPGKYAKLTGWDQIARLTVIDQKSIGRSPRSTPATYAGVFDEIRRVFASTRDAKQRGFEASRFSFNAGAGRCSRCLGQGQEKIEMNFLPDIYVTCTECNGMRFNRQTLQCRFKDRNIGEVLDMSIEDASQFFEAIPRVSVVLERLKQVGLGYLSLGQSSTTLSGGEAQRIKLATELVKNEGGKTLYLLDEPTTGLHFEDIKHLIAVLQGLVDRGNTVVVIEHNLDLIKCCDWLIDLGPEGGPGGGRIIAEGPPESIAQVRESLTGHWLKPLL